MTLRLESSDAAVEVAPERGAIVTRFSVGSREILYLDPDTLKDPHKNVRGGIPLLFPSPGKLEAGGRFSLAQHGFARALPWEVVTQRDDEVTLSLRSNDATRAVYPWDFVVTCRYRLLGKTLRIEQRFEGDDGMVFANGFHPYFLAGDKRKARVPTAARRAWDNVQKKEVELPEPIDFSVGEVDLHFWDGDEAALILGDGHRVAIRASAEFRRWVVWTLPGKDFICLEPWTSPANALNTGEHLLSAPADLWVEVAFE